MTITVLINTVLGDFISTRIADMQTLIMKVNLFLVKDALLSIKLRVKLNKGMSFLNQKKNSLYFPIHL